MTVGCGLRFELSEYVHLQMQLTVLQDQPWTMNFDGSRRHRHQCNFRRFFREGNCGTTRKDDRTDKQEETGFHGEISGFCR